jgi:hypothetical protein
MKWLWSNYLANQTNVKDPTVSPLQASIEQLKGLQHFSSTERMMYYAMRELLLKKGELKKADIQ